MATLKIKNANGQWEVAETPAAVKYTEQNLTDAQKVQARANIGASSYTTHMGTELIYSMTQDNSYYMSCPSNFNVGDLYINTDENRVYRCTQGSTRREDVDFEVYYSYWTPAEFGVIEEYNNVNHVSFNWSQFLGEPRFVKMNFAYNSGFDIVNENLQSIGKPRTLYLNLSTTIDSTQSNRQNLNIQTVYDNKIYTGKWAFDLSGYTGTILNTLMPQAEPYTKGEVDMKVTTLTTSVNSRIAIYNNIRPSTFDWWSAINHALGNTEVDDSEMQTGAFQLNLADGCYFTGFDKSQASTRLTSAIVNFTLTYLSEGYHTMVLSTEWNGEKYVSQTYNSRYDDYFNFYDIPDSIPFTKCVKEVTAIPTTTIDALFN